MANPYMDLANRQQNLPTSGIDVQSQALDLADKLNILQKQQGFRQALSGMDLSNPDIGSLVKQGYGPEALPLAPQLLGLPAQTAIAQAQNSDIRQKLGLGGAQPSGSTPQPSQAVPQTNVNTPSPIGMPPGIPQQQQSVAQQPPSAYDAFLKFSNSPLAAYSKTQNPAYYSMQEAPLLNAARQQVSDELKQAVAGTSDPNAREPAIEGVLSKYSALSNDPGIKEQADVLKKTNPVFNIEGLMSAKAIPAIMTDFAKERSDYEKRSNAFITAQGIQDSKAWGTGVGDQNLIDQAIIMETGARPTVAQYNAFANTRGLGDMVNLATGKLKEGAKLTPEVREAVLSDMQTQMQNRQDAFDQTLQNSKDQIGMFGKGAGIDPDKALNPGGTYTQAKKFLDKLNAKGTQTNSSGGNTAPKEGDTKTNSHGVNVIFKGGQWQAQ